MLKVAIKMVKKTGRWTAYHGSHKAAEYATRAAAFEAEVAWCSAQGGPSPEAWEVRLVDKGAVAGLATCDGLDAEPKISPPSP